MSKPEATVIAFVAPVGSDLTKIINFSEQRLTHYGCAVRKYEISKHFPTWLSRDKGLKAKGILKQLRISPTGSYKNIWAKMDAGDFLCTKYGKPEYLAKLVCSEIRTELKNKRETKPTAYLLRQLKRPDELNYLKREFGDGLFTIGVYGAKDFRLEHLSRDAKCTRRLAEKLLERDEGVTPRSKYGQGIQKIFQSVDAFVDSFSKPDDWQSSLNRIFELLMGNPFVAPLAHEHAMFSAFTASLQSLDLSRQVGAVLTDEQFNVISSGYNEVPKAFGGQYRGNDDAQLQSRGHDDGRDLRRREDSNRRAILNIVKQIRNGKGGASLTDKQAAQWLEQHPECLLASTSDFGRPVHAEVSAILACARKGISTHESVMFCTTYPCQNCAKHIICSGIKTIYFIEPYPKSLAEENHRDAIFENNSNNTIGEALVELKPYMGIGPRRYYDLFALKSGSGVDLRRKGNGENDLAQRLKWPEDANKIRSDKKPLGFPKNQLQINGHY